MRDGARHGGLFPRPGARSGFVAEPAQNLVHRDLWSERGSTFVARRAQEEREFLASTDSWFRPVYLTIGPDGVALPRGLLPPDDRAPRVGREPRPPAQRGHVRRAGSRAHLADHGRRTRRPPAACGCGSVPRMTRSSSRRSQTTTRWWRRTAQRLLVERRRTQAVPLLLRLFAESSKALARLHALWTLEGLGALDEATLAKALADPEPGVRENAIILASRACRRRERPPARREGARPRRRRQSEGPLPAARGARQRGLRGFARRPGKAALPRPRRRVGAGGSPQRLARAGAEPTSRPRSPPARRPSPPRASGGRAS